VKLDELLEAREKRLAQLGARVLEILGEYRRNCEQAVSLNNVLDAEQHQLRMTLAAARSLGLLGEGEARAAISGEAVPS
jgi:hypothetical protein